MNSFNSFNQEPSGNAGGDEFINEIMDINEPEIPIDPALLQQHVSPSQFLPSEMEDVLVSQATGLPATATHNIQRLTLPGPAFPAASVTEPSHANASEQLQLQLERIGAVPARQPPVSIPGRSACLQCQMYQVSCSFLTEDDPSKLTYKCADCHLNNRECRTRANQLPLPARPLPRSMGIPPYTGYGSTASDALSGYQGTAYSATNVNYTAPPSENSFLPAQPGGLFPPASPAPMEDPSVPESRAVQQGILEPSRRRTHAEMQQGGDDAAARPAKRRFPGNRCYLCSKNDLNCHRLVDGDNSSGCARCQTFGLICWDFKDQRVLPTALDWAGFNASPASLFYRFCKRCQDEGWGCDRSRPCSSCRHTGHQCVEQVQGKMKTARNAFLNGTAPGQDSELYRMSLGYGPWGIGTIRPPNRPDLPGPLNVLIGNRSNRENYKQPRPEITNHLIQNNDAFVFPPPPADPNGPALQQLRGRGYPGRERTTVAYGWNSMPGGRLPPELVALPQLQQQHPQPAAAAQSGLHPAPVIPAQQVVQGQVPVRQPDPQAAPMNLQQESQAQAQVQGPDYVLDPEDIELFNALSQLQANNWQFH